uniref:FAM13A-like domain-containing protein n=1 Tax=Xiphophorus couchianus TaxID=32473 RepID=A0A3B5M943_9TELE
MSNFQLSMEKTCMQKCLLYFEGLHGRPITRQQRTLMKPFYDRYRLLKQLLSSASTPQFTSSVEMSGTPVVSPLDEGKTFHAQIITMATLHEASRYSFSAYWRVCAHVYNKPEAFIRFALELLDHLRMVRLEKRRLHQTLQEFEDRFYAQTGRVCQKEDRGPMAEEYCQYKNLKAKLRLLEALLSKQDSTKAS